MTKINHKVTIPGYRIIRKVGEGGMSVVYLAYQESLKREVALKVMRPIITDEENVVRRFEQEAEIIAKLYHPNIVSIYEVGHVDDDVLYYSMPYLQHGDLTSFAYHNDDELKEVMSGICDGLAYAHTQGVVHRDIKPENILFDQFGHVQIADFGIALSTGRRRFTRENRIVGSIYYMSPEQAQSKHVDARSDIYGLGAILFEILTGDPVFNEEDDLSLMMAHVSTDIPLLPEALSHWQPIINKCLAKSPNQRYQSMAALKSAIQAVKQKAQPTQRSYYLKTLAVTVIVGIVLWQFWPQQNKTKSSITVPVTTLNPSAAKVDMNGQSSEVDLNEGAHKVLNVLSEDKVKELISDAQSNIKTKQLTTPADDNALDQILTVLRNLPTHQVARGLLSDVMAGYYDLAYQAVQKNDLELATQFAESVAEVRHRTILTDEHLMAFLEQNTKLESSLLLGAIAEKVKTAKARVNHDKANQLIDLVDKIMPGHQIIAELNDVIEDLPSSGQILTDSKGLKSVVVLPQHNEIMGLINYGLAVSQAEVSWQLYNQFTEATDHAISRCKSEIGSNMIFSQRSYLKPGFAVKDNMPVVCITWQDANAFIQWYNQQTGLAYRLPTPLEWRHLLKLSGNQQPKCGSANTAGVEFPNKDEAWVAFECDDRFPFLAPSNQLKKNTLGLWGFHGNAAEWLAGCEALGKIKSMFNSEDLCESNPVAGYSWLSGGNDKQQVKQVKFDQAWSHIGFRLVRNLN